MLHERVDPEEPEATAVAAVAQRLLAGGVVAYPTETFYALGADPRNAVALDRVLELKGRGSGKPLLLLLDTQEMVASWARRVPATLPRLADRFWPGPLTVVLAARLGLHARITGGGRTVALRVSSHPVARELIRRGGVAVTGTSANRSGEPPACDSPSVLQAFGSRLDAFLDAGPTPGGKPSTLVDLTAEPHRILREGAIPRQQIDEALTRW